MAFFDRSAQEGCGFGAASSKAALVALVLLTLGCASAAQRWQPAARLERSPDSQTFRYSEAVEINFEENGSGSRTVLFLHGIGSSLRNWDEIRDLIDRSDLRLAFLDLKGFGLSSRPRDNRYSVQAQAKIVRAFIDSRGYRPVVLVGHSYGGAVALMTTLLLQDAGRGDLVERLVLIDSAAYADSMPLFFDLLRAPLLGRLSTWLLPRRLQLKMMLKKAFFDDRLVTPERLERYVRFYRLPGSRYSLRKVARQAVPPNYADLERRYLSVTVPAYLIWGEHDRMLPVDETGERLARDLRALELEIVVECGHIPQEEQAARTAGLLSRFLADR